MCSMVKNINRISAERASNSPRTFLRRQLRIDLKTRFRAGKTPLSALGMKYSISVQLRSDLIPFSRF